MNLFYVKTVETPSVVILPQSLFSQHSVWQALVTFNGVVLESAVRIESVAMWRPALSYTLLELVTFSEVDRLIVS